MKLKLLNKDKTLIRIEVDERDMTLLHPLVEELLKDKAVANAQYILGHPELDKPILKVEVRTGKPETAIKRATKALIDNFKDFRKTVEKEIK